MLSDEFLQELKRRCDIEDIISSYVELKRKGRGSSGLCPFHSEKTPSFTVYNDTQSFYCFGCGAGGDVITFIKRAENLEYLDAVKHLANRAGLPIPESGLNEGARPRVLEINRAAAKFFHQKLMEPGCPGFTYLTGRGLSQNIIRHFGLGFAPPGWGELTSYLKSEGYKEDELVAAGVSARAKNGTNVYDIFRNRVMFPIIDLRGSVIGFGGRVMEGDGPKYLNSSDTAVFKKSRNLYAFNFAKSSQKGHFILCEGYMDVIALHKAGFTEAVATLGTALTPEQARLLSQYTKEVILCYDSDEAGKKAANRAVTLLEQVGLRIRILSLSGAKDPDEYIKLYGRERFSLILKDSRNATEYSISELKAKHDLTGEAGRLEFVREVTGLLAAISSPVERELYTARIAGEISISPAALTAAVDRERQRLKKGLERQKKKEELKIFVPPEINKLNPKRAGNRKAAASEEGLITALLKNPDYLRLIEENIDESDFVTDTNRRIYGLIRDRIKSNRSVDIFSLSGELTGEEMSVVSYLLSSNAGLNVDTGVLMEYMGNIKSAARRNIDVSTLEGEELSAYLQGLQRKNRGK